MFWESKAEAEQRRMTELVRQGAHYHRIVSHFRDLRAAFEIEFHEDNKPTQEAFLQECFDASKRR